jgi:hypothetical protein
MGRHQLRRPNAPRAETNSGAIYFLCSRRDLNPDVDLHSASDSRRITGARSAEGTLVSTIFGGCRIPHRWNGLFRLCNRRQGLAGFGRDDPRKANIGRRRRVGGKVGDPAAPWFGAHKAAFLEAIKMPTDR